MSNHIVDIGTQSTTNTIVDKIGDAIGIGCFPSEKNYTGGGTYFVGATGSRATVAIKIGKDIYILLDNGKTFYRMTNDSNCWRVSFYAPYVIDVHESCILTFDNPVTEKTEVHILGGHGFQYRSHYKWDGESWSVASELPYNFCAGKAVVFNGEIHIFGGGSNHFQTFIQDGWLNYHYKWDGESWEKVSDPPFNLCGSTPVVHKNTIKLIGGTANQRQFYSFIDNKWNKLTDIPNNLTGAMNASVIVYNDSIHVLGGANTSGVKIGNHILYNDSSGWSSALAIPKDGYCDTSNGVVENNGLLWVIGYRAYSLKLTSNNSNWATYMGINSPLNGGVIVNVNGTNYENLVMISNNSMIPVLCSNDVVFPSNTSCDITNAAITTDSNNNIHIVTDYKNANTHYRYKRTITPDGCVEYTMDNSSEIVPGYLTNISIAWHNGHLHVIGYREQGILHYRLDDTGWVPVSVHEFMLNKNIKLVEISRILYAVFIDKSNRLKIYQFDGVGWRCIYSYTLTDSIIDFDVIEYYGKLHIGFITSLNTTKNAIKHCVYSGSTLLWYEQFDVEGYSELSMVPYNGYIHIFVSNSTNTEDYCVKYHTSEKNVLEVYLPKGHQLICNKNEFVPIVGIVIESNSGYVSTDSGVYRFVMLNDSSSYSIA